MKYRPISLDVKFGQHSQMLPAKINKINAYKRHAYKTLARENIAFNQQMLVAGFHNEHALSI